MYNSAVCFHIRPAKPVDTDLSPAWKQSLPSSIYFIPDFDETQGYYEAANGVSVKDQAVQSTNQKF